MTDTRAPEKFETLLAAYGADISRWPAERSAGAREALLGQLDFRRAYDAERAFDVRLKAHRQELDAALAGSGAAERVKRRALRGMRQPLAAMDWRRIAAAVLVAGMLGGAIDLALAERAPDEADIVMLDPLTGLDETGMQ